MNKKGQLITLSLAGGMALAAIIVFAVIVFAVLGSGVALISWLTHYAFMIAGLFIITFGVIYAARTGKDMGRNMLIVVLIGGAVMAISLIPNLQQTAFGSTTALSISNVVVDGANKIRVYAVATGAEELTIDFTQEDLNEYLNKEGLAATKDVRGSIRFVKQEKIFPIIKNTDQVFYVLGVQNIGTFTSCSKENCNSKIPSGSIAVGAARELKLLSIPCICTYRTSKGINGVFSSSATKNFQVDFNIGGQTGSLTENTRNINLGSAVQVEWTGDLSNLNEVNAPTSYSVLFDESQYKGLISSSAYPNIVTASSEFSQCTTGSPFNWNVLMGPASLVWGFFDVSESKLKSCANTFNNQVDSAILLKTTEYTNSVSNYVESINFDGSNLIAKLKIPETFPTFIITLDATKVGLITLAGEPLITQCPAEKTINSGDIYNTNIVVKNIGSSAGSFYGVITCDNGATASAQELLFEAGETGNLPVTITGSNTVSGTKSYSCTYKVVDRKSQKTDDCVSILRVDYQSGIQCKADSVTCVGTSTLRTCSSDGKSFTDKECSYQCTQTAGVGKCIIKDDGQDDDNDINVTGTKAECDAKAAANPWLGYTWVQKNTKVGSGPLGILGLIGITKQIDTSYCSASNMIYIVMIIIAILIIAAIVIVVVTGRKKKRNNYRRRR